MSWSFSCTGSREVVKKALQEALKSYGLGTDRDTPQNQSLVEFKEAAPALETLIDQNFATDRYPYSSVILDVSASGSGSYDSDGILLKSCTVNIKPIFVKKG